MTDSEQTFTDRLRLGEERAYRELYARYYGVLCVAAERYVRDRFMAECIVENVIFALWEKRERLGQVSSLRAYLTVSVRNAAVNWLRSQYSRNVTLMSHLSEADRAFVEHASVTPQPTDALVTDETVSEVLSSLPPECRAVFVSVRLDGLSYQEAAEALGISVNTVKYHMKKALAVISSRYGTYFSFLALSLAAV